MSSDYRYHTVGGGEEMAGTKKKIKREKIYVKVNSDFDSTGAVTPQGDHLG